MTALESSGCYIAVGSNIDPKRHIPLALDMLNASCPVQAISCFYRTAPIKRPEQPFYLNGAVSVAYLEHPRVLKYDVLRPIEAALGRQRTGDAYAARPIDLDVVLCGPLVVEEPGLTIPDPDIRERAFLAAALLDLNPTLLLPDTHTPVKTLITETDYLALDIDRPFTMALRERFIQ